MTQYPTILEDEGAVAKLVAIVIRNGMEDFHVKHLSDAQMRELNPIIRNAVFTALHALRNVRRSDGARAFIDYQLQHIPKYWEEPQLWEGYVATLKRRGEGMDPS